MDEETTTRRFTEQLAHPLTDGELADIGRNAAKQGRLVTEYEDLKKDDVADWNAKIKKASDERDRLLTVLASGAETRDVECIETHDLRTGRVIVTRADTGAVVRERAMTAAERQGTLPGVAPRYEPEDDEDPTRITDPIGTLGADAEVKPLKRMRKKNAKGS